MNESEKLTTILADFRNNTVVRACAGSGKTRLLAAKYLTALLWHGDPKGLAAITFTEKAAQELKSRIQDFLSRIAQAHSQDTLMSATDLPWAQVRA
ncbi:MAG: UvrD-helicase domain-containing protein, partial [Elusimicrobiota bacterium]